MICGYIIWRNNHADEERLRRVASGQTEPYITLVRRVIVQDWPRPALSGKGSN